MQALPPGGAMVAVQAGEDEVAKLLGDLGDLGDPGDPGGLGERVGIAAVNGPKAIVVSGERAAVERVAAALAADGRKTKALNVSHAFHSPLMDPMLAQFRAVLDTLTYRPPRIPIVSTLTGRLAAPDELCSPEYWTRHARAAVRFHDAVRLLADLGTTVFLELGPDAVLTAMGRDCLADHDTVVLAPLARRGHGEVRTAVGALATAAIHQVPVDWPAFFGPGRRAVDLPTYAFQRRRYWLEVQSAGDVGSAGLGTADHPLLSATLSFADGRGRLFTGRLSRHTHPWLAEHALPGAAVLPAAAFLEMAVRAGDEVGCGQVADLVLATPLTLPDRGGVQVQLTVGEPDDAGRRTATWYSRQDDTWPGDPWVRHAECVLLPGAPRPAAEPAAWPPSGATPVDLTAWDERAAASRTAGTAARGLTALWRRGGELFAEVRLPERLRPEAAKYRLHPALLEAVVYAVSQTGPAAGEAAAAQAGAPTEVIPFAWDGVTLHACGAAALRVRITPRDGGVGLSALDEQGEPVLTVGELALRRTPVRRIETAGRARQDLYRLDWEPLPPHRADGTRERWALVGGDAGERAELLARLRADGVRVEEHPDPAALTAAPGAAPDVVVLLAPTGQQAAAALESTAAAADDAGPRLVLVTGDPLVHAAAGAARSDRPDHPERVVLLDADPDTAPAALTAAALTTAVASGEPRVRVRDGVPYALRLSRPALPEAPAPVDDGTVLVTAAAGAAGAAAARHLAVGGARRLLLVGAGPTPELAALEAGLAESGVDVGTEPCDLADRAAVTDLLAKQAATSPVTTVLHGVDGTEASAAAADTLAHAIGETTRLLLFAPASDVLDATPAHPGGADSPTDPGGADSPAHPGGADSPAHPGGADSPARPGGADSPARPGFAGGFADALAWRGRAGGRAITSLRWGPWECGPEPAASVPGFRTLGLDDGLALFDAARALTDPVVVAAAVDFGAVRQRCAGRPLPAVLRGTAKAPQRRAVAAGAAERSPSAFAGLSAEERREAVLRTVRELAALVLGHADADAVGPRSAFLELGFDSLSAVDLRTRLNTAFDLKLGATVAFDHPSAQELAEHVCDQLAAAGGAPGEQAAAGEADGAGPLGTLYWRACTRGKFAEAEELLRIAARIQPSFAEPADADVPRPVRLASGPAEPVLICFPSFSPVAGPHEYARLSARFRAERDVLALPQPGFRQGQSLPESVHALASAHAEGVIRCAEGRSFALVGRSAGGWIAHAVAGRLAQLGGPAPVGLVLIDSSAPEHLERSPFGTAMAKSMLERESQFDLLSDDRLAAMGAYSTIFAGWSARPHPRPVPTLLLRARDPFDPELDAMSAACGVDWRARWDQPHVVKEVPGNHFTVLEDEADTTAEALAAWLPTVTGG
jgi:surfactin synthase thioesterase subunit/acyl carrier protein